MTEMGEEVNQIGNKFLFFGLLILLAVTGILFQYFFLLKPREEEAKREEEEEETKTDILQNSELERELNTSTSVYTEAVNLGVDPQDLASKSVLTKQLQRTQLQHDVTVRTKTVADQQLQNAQIPLEDQETTKEVGKSVDNFLNQVDALDKDTSKYEKDTKLGSEFKDLSSSQKLTASMLKTITGTVQELEKEIRSKKGLLVGMKSDISSSKQQIETTQNQMMEDLARYANESRRLSRDMTQKAKMTKIFSDLTMQMTTVNNEKAVVSEQVRELKLLKKKLEDKMELQEAEKTATTKKISLQEAIIQQATARLKSLGDNLTVLVKQQSDSASKLQDSVLDQSDIGNKLVAVAKDLAATRALRESVRSQVSDLKQIVANLQQTEQGAKQHLSETQTKIAALQAQQTTLQSNLSDIQTRLQEQEAAETEALKDGAVAQQQQAILQKELVTMQADATALKSEVDGLLLQKAMVEKQLGEKKDQITKASAQVLALDQQVVSEQNKMDALTAKLADQTAILGQKNQDLASTASRLKTITDTQSAIKQQQSILVEQILNLKKERDALEGKLSQTAQTVQSKVSSVNTLENQLTTLVKHVEDGSNQLSQIQKQQNDITLSVANSQSLKASIEKQVALVTSQKDTLQTAATALRNEISQLQNQLATISGPMNAQVQAQQNVVDGMVARLGVLQNSLQTAETSLNNALASQDSASKVVQALNTEIQASIVQQNQVDVIAQALQNNLETVVQGDWGMHGYTFGPTATTGMVGTPVPVIASDNIISANYKVMQSTVPGGCAMLTPQMACMGVGPTPQCVVTDDQPRIIPDDGKVVACVTWSPSVLSVGNGGAVTIDRIVALGKNATLGATVSARLPFQGPIRKDQTVYPGQTVGLFVTSSLDPNSNNWICVLRSPAVAGVNPNTGALSVNPQYFAQNSTLQMGRGTLGVALNPFEPQQTVTSNNDFSDVSITVCNGVLSVQMQGTVLTDIGNIEATGILFCGLVIAIASQNVGITDGNNLQTTLAFESVVVTPTTQCTMLNPGVGFQIGTDSGGTFFALGYAQPAVSGTMVGQGEAGTPTSPSFYFQESNNGYILRPNSSTSPLNLSIVNNTLCIAADNYVWNVIPVPDSYNRIFYISDASGNYLGLQTPDVPSGISSTPFAWSIKSF